MAERVTALDPKRAKGWWRRGTVAELLKFFVDALRFYRIAVELQPQEVAFQRAYKAIQKRVKTFPGQTTPQGYPVVEMADTDPNHVSSAFKAWWKVKQEYGDEYDYITLGSVYYADQVMTQPLQEPTSQPLFFKGMRTWVMGLKVPLAV